MTQHLSTYLSTRWPLFAQKLDSMRVLQHDVHLFLQWSLDRLRAGNSAVVNDLWGQLREAIRVYTFDHGLTPSRDDLNLMADTVCAMTLSCLGLLREGSQSQMPLYQRVVAGLGQHQESVRQAQQMLTCDEHTESLRQCLSDYWDDDLLLTLPDAMEWVQQEPLQTWQHLDGRNIVHVHHPQGCTFIENQTINENIQPS